MDSEQVEQVIARCVEQRRYPWIHHPGAWDQLLAAGPMADGLLDQRLRTDLGALWERGWTPADLVRVVGKQQGDGARDLARHAVLVEHSARNHPPGSVSERWEEQLRSLRDAGGMPARSPVTGAVLRAGRPAAFRAAVAVLAMAAELPSLPQSEPPPGRAGQSGGRARRSAHGVEPKILDRIRALLAKAEATNFPEEAEAFTTKAQELMATHSVEQAMLAGPASDGPESLRIVIDDPYADAKVNILHVVALANRSRSIYSKDLGFATVFGFDHDLAAVELLFTSLLVQATRAMAAHGSIRDPRGRSRTRSFRHSFLGGFAARIGERLREATATSTATATAALGEAVLPVLARRDEQVDSAVRKAFPHLRSTRSSVSNASGWFAGRAAADQARLGPRDALAG